MKIDQIYIYPIKSLRPASLSSATATYQGFQYDRRFMLFDVSKGKNMHIATYARMCLFRTSITFPTSAHAGKILVTFNPPDAEKPNEIEIPLEPDVFGLETVEISMHNSPCTAFSMGQLYNAWFSACFGFPVQFLYMGPSSRQVLGNISPTYTPEPASFFSSLKSNIAYYTTTVAVDKGLTFADCAPFLVVTTASLSDVNTTTGLPDDDQMQIEKFRPNIVLSGSELEPWEEDLWGSLTFYPSSNSQSDTVEENKSVKLDMKLTANCARCTSLNVDFRTGKPGKSQSGTILKKLSKYRRVDKGTPYSPVFGRYGFLFKMPEEGVKMSVGDEVVVTGRNEERTKWYWPGL